MHEQDKDLMARYGDAMLYAHLIEDILDLILRDAAFFHVNGYSGPAKPIPELKFDERIKELARAFPDAGRLVEDLHRIRKIRNKLTHAFVPQVGSDLLSAEGRDQVHAMLDRFVRHASARRRILGQILDTLRKQALATDLRRLFEREEEEFDARVAQSDIQQLLDQLDAP